MEKEIIPETEQWKLNGNCEKCRRKPFCRKSCGAQKRREARILSNWKEAMLDLTLPGMPHYY